jgi:WD40 repeat protein
MKKYQYHVGGSLDKDAPSYVVRDVDTELYSALKAGEFCYLLNCRQMGKSSVLVRTLHQLQQEGYKCSTVDMTRIGSENITPQQWYKGLVADLWRGFGLIGKFNLKAWWREEGDISLLHKLSDFIEDVLLVRFSQEKIVIFIDEIDSILSLNFPVDDFFAFIRFCYNQRVINAEYKRLTFAIFGVANPSDLIADKNRTPFNIGRAIGLRGFKWEEAQPLAVGFEEKVSNAKAVIREILAWTSGQPFLTQKLCLLVSKLLENRENESEQNRVMLTVPAGTEAFWIESIVRENIIDKWESQDEPEHLRTISDRILLNEHRADRLLGIYQQILQGVEIPTDDSREQIELLLSGLVVKQEGLLKVKNRIYQAVFNLEWVEKQLGLLLPYSQAFDAWVASGQKDTSRLLRGQALKDAQMWALGKSLSDLNYQFLAASAELDNQEIQQSLEAARLKEVEARLAEQKKRLEQQRKSAQVQRLSLMAVSTAFTISVGFGVTAYQQYRQAALNEVKAIASASEGHFNSNRRLDALVQAIKANRKLQQLNFISFRKTEIESQIKVALERAVYGADEFNRLLGEKGSVPSVSWSPDGQTIATSSNTGVVKLWKRDGTLLKTLPCNATTHSVRISPDNSLVAAGGLDGSVTIWKIDGTQVATLKKHTAPVWRVAFSPDSQTIASTSGDSTIKLWKRDGTLINTLKGNAIAVWGVAFSPDGQTIASSYADGKIELRKLDGTAIATFQAHNASAWNIVFSPDGKLLASASADNTVKLWKRDGTLLEVFKGHTAEVLNLAFSPDGQVIASASGDKTVRLWNKDGTLLKIFRGHDSVIRDVVFSPDGQAIASASDDNSVRFWKTQKKLLRAFYDHRSIVWDVAFSPNSQLVAAAAGEELELWKRNGSLAKKIYIPNNGFLNVTFSANSQEIIAGSSDGTITLWNLNGMRQDTLKEHKTTVWDITLSQDGQFMVSAGDDGRIKLWQRNPSGQFQLVQSIKAHSSRIWNVSFSPDGQYLASASQDRYVKLWTWKSNGKALQLYKTLKGHKSGIWGLAISPNSELVASGGRDDTLKLWKRNGTLLRTIQGNSMGLNRVAFSHDGQMVAAGSVDNSVKLWKIDGTLLTTLIGHTSNVGDVHFSPDGRFLASGGDDQTVILWDLQEILHLDFLNYGCNWVRDYLRTNVEVEDSDRHLCDPPNPSP